VHQNQTFFSHFNRFFLGEEIKEKKAQTAENYLRNLGMELFKLRETRIEKELTVKSNSSAVTQASPNSKRKRIVKRKVRKNKKKAKYAQLQQLTINLGVRFTLQFLFLHLHFLRKAKSYSFSHRR
jgi:hypothetical protein